MSSVLTMPASATSRPGTSLAFAGPASMLALSTSRCQPIALCGPEDVAIDGETGIAYVSSQARPGGVGEREYLQPGAIYTLRLEEPLPEAKGATPSVASDGYDPADFHPHGIDLIVDEDGRARLFVIDHTSKGSRIQVFDVSDRKTGALSYIRSIGPDPALQNPNDIAAVGRDEFYFSNSSSSENRTLVLMQEILLMRTGSVAHCMFGGRGVADLKIVERGFSFLSGVAVDRKADPKRVYVAPLWARKVIVYEQTPSGDLKETGREIDLPGGPDNLSLDEFGSLWIGAAPDMAAVTSYALGDREIAPSLVLRIPDPKADRPTVERVFTDDGRLISAASAAAYYERRGLRRLLVGAPFQDRMLIIDLA